MYRKIRFYSKVYGPTAGLVVDATKLKAMTIQEISRLFPYTETMKMISFEQSEDYQTFELAFHHTFPAIDKQANYL